MCPTCLTSAAMILAGTTPASVLTALIIKSIKPGVENAGTTTPTKGEPDGPSSNRSAR